MPEKDEDRIVAIQAAIDREELLLETERAFLDGEILEFKTFVRKYEGEIAMLQHTQEDRTKTLLQYKDLFKNAQMYIAHFIQVLQLTVIRNEIKFDHLSCYGFETSKELEMPDLSTEDAVLIWGEKIIRGESERLSRGGMPLYNPAIAKVRVHYELFRDIIQSLKIYRQNALRYQANVVEMRKKAAEYIEIIRARILEKYKDEPEEKQQAIFKLYKFCFYQIGEQLNVFD